MDLQLPLPPEKLPQCWWDPDQLSYLFSPFRSQAHNPSDREIKLRFWKPLLRAWCEHNKRCTFTLSELQCVFRKESLVPVCLRNVLDEMLRSGELLSKCDFLQTPPHTWMAWALHMLVRKPLVWSLRKAQQMVVSATEQQDTQYVLVEAVKVQADAVVAAVRHASKINVLSLNEVHDICTNSNATLDVEPVIHWLLCHGRVITDTTGLEVLIKFVAPEEQAKAITEIDRGVHALCRTEKTLTAHLEDLEAEKLTAVNAAKEYLAKGMRHMAKSSLRRKQVLENCIDKRMAVLDNVHLLLGRVQDAQADTKILESYRQSLHVLKKTFKDAGVTEDSTADTMLQIQEVLDIQNEIKDSLSLPLAASDEAELEKELVALLAEEGDKMDENLTKTFETIELTTNIELPTPSKPAAAPTNKRQLLA